MRLPAKCDVRDAITPPPRSVRVPPVGGRPRGLTRVGCCESHRPSSRSVSVWASETFQSNRRNATVLSVVRSSERPWTCAGAPLAAASARNREAESGLTPSRASVRGSAEASAGNACPRQRPEHAQPVPDEGAPHPAAQLVLGVPLPERRRGGLTPGERAVAQRVGERPLRDVLAAAGRRGDEAAGELAPGRVVAARDDAGRADRILRHTAPAE